MSRPSSRLAWLALALAPATVPASAHAGARPSCAAQTATMRLVALQSTPGTATRPPVARTRVAARTRRVRRGDARVRETTFYGCAEPARRLVRLGLARSDNLLDPDSEDQVEWLAEFRLAPRHVAFVQGHLDQGTGDPPLEWVVVVDLRRGRRLTPTPPCAPIRGPYCGEVDALQLNARGIAAWGVTTAPADTATVPERVVWVHDSAGARTVDRGADVDPRSVALGSTWVGWWRGGAPRSAPVG